MLAIKSHLTANDPLSRRIFRDDNIPPALQAAETLVGLRAELKALEQENDVLQRTLKLSSGLRQRFETLFDASPLGLLSCDSDDMIVEANLTLAKLLQSERKQLIGQHFGQFVAVKDHARFIQHLNQLRGNNNEMLSIQKIDESDVDPLIKSLEQELRSSLLASKPSFTGLFPETGMLINTFA